MVCADFAEYLQAEWFIDYNLVDMRQKEQQLQSLTQQLKALEAIESDAGDGSCGYMHTSNCIGAILESLRSIDAGGCYEYCDVPW
jgi:hypothetical protein